MRDSDLRSHVTRLPSKHYMAVIFGSLQSARQRGVRGTVRGVRGTVRGVRGTVRGMRGTQKIKKILKKIYKNIKKYIKYKKMPR